MNSSAPADRQHFGAGCAQVLMETSLARVWLYRDLTSQPIAQYFAWVSLPVCLILFSAGFVHLIAPQSIGK
uniref:Uncharacterized protein n=1 Tax=Glossina palpalis gambiensis TaxID=67801 RepID=A0A1B0ASJ3_9MUSC